MGTLPATPAATAEQRRKRAWLHRIGECVLVTAIMAGLILTLTVTGFGSPWRLVGSFLVTVLSVGVGIYWAASTARLLRGGVFHLTGFLIAVLAAPITLVTGGFDAETTGGRTAFLVLGAVFLLQFAAALVSALIRLALTTQHPADND
jgi:hypothetical protein